MNQQSPFSISPLIKSLPRARVELVRHYTETLRMLTDWVSSAPSLLALVAFSPLSRTYPSEHFKSTPVLD